MFVNKVVINDMNFEDAYNEAIQQKSIAQQNADKQKIENEVAIAKAEADKQVAITNAEAEAQKTSIAADAQAEANTQLAESLSDTLIDYQKIQKWDGKLPTVRGGNGTGSALTRQSKRNTRYTAGLSAQPILHEILEDYEYGRLQRYIRDRWQGSKPLRQVADCAFACTG